MSKYIHESWSTGEPIYPNEISQIRSKEDMHRWFEWCEQFLEHDDLKSFKHKIAAPMREESSGDYQIFYIKFPRCKYESHAVFYGNECSSISIN